MASLDSELSTDYFKETTSHKIHFTKGTACDFEWKDYCPTVFRNIQELHNIDYTEYKKSLCGEKLFVRVLSSARCGSVFVSSADDRFVIKMLRRSELKSMLEILPNYYRHLQTYRGSLLSKLYGLHVVRPLGGVKVYFAVTSNIMRSNLQIHSCYDLKGVAKGRSDIKMVAENCSVLKDENFDFCFYLDPLVHCRLLNQIRYDCEFLEGEGIMDYSLMLGIHKVEQHEGNDVNLFCILITGKLEAVDLLKALYTTLFESGLRNCKRSIGGESFTSGSSSSSIGDMIDDTSEGSDDAELSLSYLCSQSGRPVEKLGIQMPARARKTPKNVVAAHESVTEEEYYDVVLNFGIVDIFQSYNTLKRIEHVYKSLQYYSKSIAAVNPKLRHHSKSITTVNPKAYSSRFQDFLSRVFQSADHHASSQS